MFYKNFFIFEKFSLTKPCSYSTQHGYLVTGSSMSNCWRRMSLTSLFVLRDGGVGEKGICHFFFRWLTVFPCKGIFFLLDVALFAPLVIWRHGNAFVEEGTQTVALVWGLCQSTCLSSQFLCNLQRGLIHQKPAGWGWFAVLEIASMPLEMTKRIIVKYAVTWPCVIARNPSAMLRVNSTTKQSSSVRRLFVILT